MKCARCTHDSKYPERAAAGGCCPCCKKPFAFEPRNGEVVNDWMFRKAIERVSSGGKVKFARDHLYYELRRRRPGGLVALVLVLGLIMLGLACGLIWAAIHGDKGLLCMAVMPTILAVGFLRSYFTNRRLHRRDFNQLWARWLAAHGEPAALLPRPRAAAKDAEPFPEELLSYSFDRAVICDRSQTVDLLVANQFHFENNCAVLGVNGYPVNAFEPVRKMLRNNPRLLVIALHDATPEGCRLAHLLRTDPQWFSGVGRVVDLGLRPGHARFFPGMSDGVNTPHVSAGQGISAREAQWLRHHELALAVVRPEQIIKRLFRAIGEAEASSVGGDGGGGISSFDTTHTHHGHTDSDSMGSDADASDGGADSFG